jgi:cytochrome c oxidase cbb3-type subunit 1
MPHVEHNDSAVKQMILPAIIFMVIGMSVGVFISFNGFVFPDYFKGEYIHFGRVRPVHVNAVALLWLLSADIGLMYFFVPRLCGRPLWSAKLATVSSCIWWPSLFLGVFSFPWGTNYGWEYAELPMLLGGLIPIKFLVTIAWVLIAINIGMTIFTRKYKKMYVSLWYVMGTLVWTSFTFVFGNFGLEFLPGGISKVNASFFYVHNLVGLIFTPMGVAAAYYFIPRIAKTPLWSHKLSMIGFWTIAFSYAWVGAHHIIHGPMTQWLQTVAIVFSLWLFIPVWTVVANFFLTLKGHWDQYTTSPPIRFLMMGTLFYLLTCIQGPLQSLRNINEITSKTDWIPGHAHMALYGAFTYFALAGIYHVIHVITKKPLWSKTLAEWHFTLNLIGSLLMFGSLWIGGFLQGMQWADWATGTSYAEFHNNISQVSFLQTIAGVHPWWVMRGISGIFILVGNLLFVLNIFNTIMLEPRNKNKAPSAPLGGIS